MSEILPTKQKRSAITQNNILKSLSDCLKTKYFEHISIAELADGAGVSVGTFYRRFKDKNALIPLLYQEFGHELDTWVSQLELNKNIASSTLFEFLTTEMVKFIGERSGVFRTLHLYARLYPGLVPENKMTERKKEFKRIAVWLAEQLFSDGASAEQEAKAEMWVFIMIDTLIEKVLYNDVTPAMACSMNINEFAQQLSQCLCNDYKESK